MSESRRSSLRPSSSPATTPGGRPRKKPQCQTCHLPMLGHPKKCPEKVSLSFSTVNTSSVNATTHALTGAMSSMCLTPSQRNEEISALKPRRRGLGRFPAVIIPDSDSASVASLASLSSSSKELIAKLCAPDATSDSDEEEDDTPAKLVCWRDQVKAATTENAQEGKTDDAAILTIKKKRAPRASMPGSFVPRSAETSFQSTTSTETVRPRRSPRHSLPAPSVLKASDTAPALVEVNESKAATPPAAVAEAPCSTRALESKMSETERIIFVERLNESAARASLYTIPRADVAAVEAQAREQGFHVCVIDEGSRAEDAADCLVVIGRDVAEAERMYRRIAMVQAATQGAATGDNKSVGIGKMAGAAAVGAVATFAGLAYA
ncbi:hypothetical protein FISHEDRAFT_55806 [Fistulina hepatica ATCC 64428]|uniref:Uncharacterized protein n=1 Tax=Fistulina hepatica ATCC 64428 TaxID=1128425 RepID=A0A0D7AMS6_9AGAR|nr:hypothetical protein FISHEDRAFT_55806 [Fistulina hepatica ATCC 64428]